MSSDPSQHFVLAADIGGTHMRAALVDEDGHVLLRSRADTPGHAEAPAALIELIRSVGAERSLGEVSRAVIGLPGVCDYEEGCLMWAPHLPESWPGRLSRRELSSCLDLPVEVANDADLAAVGEAYFGAARGCASMAYLTVSTGTGAGVVHGGRLLRGRSSLAEIGHTIVDWRSWAADGGGELEESGSGSGMAARALREGLGYLDAEAIGAAADGDPRALAIWRDAVASCAVAVENLLMCFSPSTVVIGGGLGRDEKFFGAVRELVLSRPAHHPDGLTVVPAALGDDAGLAGAARWDAALGRA